MLSSKNIIIECKFFTVQPTSFQQKKAEVFQISEFYSYNKDYLHKLDIKHSINEHESDDVFIYESLP